MLKYASAALTGLLKEPSTNAAVTQALRSFGVAEMAQAALSRHAQVRLLFLLALPQLNNANHVCVRTAERKP